MDFTCSILCELPFMLNLPNGFYTVLVDGGPYDLEVLQEQIAAHFGPRNFAVGAPATLRQQFRERFDSAHKQPLRTIVRHTFIVTTDESSLPVVTDNDVLDDLQSAIIGENPLRFAGDKPGLEREARQRRDSLAADERARQTLLTAKRRFSRTLADTDKYLVGVNSLIRLYMQRFNDFFVEEIAAHHLASREAIQGIYVMITSADELILHYGDIERLPPIMRRPWLNHPQNRIDEFKHDLRSGLAPDSISLLGVRARSFFQRGAYRSSIIEASAALDLSVSRKLWEGFKYQGKVDADIDVMLRSNVRFEDRAKSMLRDATGTTAALIDNTLWSRVVGHRSKFRHGIAHADAEPPKGEAEQVVNDFILLASLIRKIVPHAAIRLRAYEKWKENGCRHGYNLDDWLAAEKELVDPKAL
jgi:hypothetical protein